MQPQRSDYRGLAAGNGGSLSGRQLAAVQLLAGGYTTKEIARSMATTIDAVEHLLARAGQRLQARHRSHLVALSINLGLVR